MQALSQDTSPTAQSMHFKLMRSLTGWQRLTLAFELTAAVRKLTLADIRYRFPAATEEEIRRKFIARVLPRTDVIRAYGFDPREEDMDCS